MTDPDSQHAEDLALARACVDGDTFGEAFGATVEALTDEARTVLRDRFVDAQLESIFRLIQSNFDVSMRRLLD